MNQRFFWIQKQTVGEFSDFSIVFGFSSLKIEFCWLINLLWSLKTLIEH